MSQRSAGFSVQQAPVFEGPLDLLLHLIEREQLDITAVSLAQVTDQFLARLAQMQAELAEIEGDVLADFLVTAAKLLWIKSRALLPKPPPPEVEEDDPAEVLAAQLREYRRFKLAAQALRVLEEAHQRSFVRTAPPPTLNRPPAPGAGSLADLLRAAQRALLSAPPPPPVGTLVTPLAFTVQDKIALIRTRVAAAVIVQFDDLLQTANSAVEIVITLLALLELMKQRQVLVEQTALFDRIFIRAWPASPESGNVPGTVQQMAA